MRCSSWCPLCWVGNWISRRVRRLKPVPAPAPKSLVDEVRSWSTAQIGQYLHMSYSCDMKPGASREDSIAVLVGVLRERAQADELQVDEIKEVTQP